MIEEQHTDRLLDDVRAAKPRLEPSAEEWARSDRARRVLERVLAEADASRPARSARTRGLPFWRERWSSWGGLRLIVAAAVVVCIALAVSLVLTLVPRETELPVVAEEAPTTVATLPVVQPVESVSTASAVEHVMRLVRSMAAWTADSVADPETDQATLLTLAVSQGLVPQSELTGAAAAEPIREGQYAVLLWKAFGPGFCEATGMVDPLAGAGVAEEPAAIQGLRSAGVVREADGEFVPDRLLDAEREQLLLGRMRDALMGVSSD